jgi:hypothetical protein
LLADINAANVSFSIFDGDLKAGGDGPCSDSLYTTALQQLDTFERPMIWLPGDNDWTDCWGRYGPSMQPFFDPIERLNHERQLFASTYQSLGQKTLTLTRQAGYPQTVRWTYGPVVYLGLDAQARTTTIRTGTRTRRSPARPSGATPRSSGSETRRSRGKRRTSAGSTKPSSTRNNSERRAC